MKWMKKSPFFFLIASSAVLLTILAIGGSGTIYKEQECNLLKTPFLSVVFTGLNEGIYPWQIVAQNAQEAAAPVNTEGREEAAGSEKDIEIKEKEAEVTEDKAAENHTEEGKAEAVCETVPLASPTPAPSAEPEIMTPDTPGYSIENNRLEPLRESTHEEYMNHISADIYGDAGVLRAAEVAYASVEEDYFDDALFIGDSRTVGLRDYTDLAEHADFLCETSLTVYKVMEQSFKGYGTVEDALKAKDYGKIYLMVGINELGRGTTEDFMAKYTEVIDALHALEPKAKIFIQGIMRVSGKKNAADAIFNNANINARNNAVATLADGIQVFYIDVNEAVCDEEGNLNADYTFDQIHLLGVYNDLWKQFLLSHGVN